LKAILDWLEPWVSTDRTRVRGTVDKVRALAGWIRPRLEKGMIFIIVLGITLPTMHQSSLGSMLLIAGAKLHALWQSPFLPFFFLINCIYIGYSIAILESVISSYAFRRPYEIRQLSGLAGIIPWLATVWLVAVVGDLVWRGQVGAALSLDFYSRFFLAETGALGIGSLILFNSRNRRSPRWLFVSAALIVLGGGLYRFNVYLIGFNPNSEWIYFPSLAEIMISVGIVAIELLGYQVLVKLVPVLPKIHYSASAPAGAKQTPSRASGIEPVLEPASMPAHSMESA
jgi:Ni/Fe-hydrogenase subunit HybB-like protein